MELIFHLLFLGIGIFLGIPLTFTGLFVLTTVIFLPHKTIIRQAKRLHLNYGKATANTAGLVIAALVLVILGLTLIALSLAFRLSP